MRYSLSTCDLHGSVVLLNKARKQVSPVSELQSAGSYSACSDEAGMAGPHLTGAAGLAGFVRGSQLKKMFCCLLAAVSINRAPFTKASRRRVGFVLQDDVLYESLTVKVDNAAACLANWIFAAIQC